jgi:hypothetical protein
MRRFVIAASACCVLTIAIGCMSFSFGDRTEVVAPGVPYTRQTGLVSVPPGQELTIYYPNPYQSPPNLVIADPSHDCHVSEQHPDYFRVKNDSAGLRDFEWTARGTLPNVPVSQTSTPAH